MANSGSDPQRAPGGFGTTRWSLVAAAKDPSKAAQSLNELCLRYWFPVYAWLRSNGSDAPKAHAVARSFFRDLVYERLHRIDPAHQGRFRDFVLQQLVDFTEQRNRSGHPDATSSDFPAPMTVEQSEARFISEPDAASKPEQAFQRGFAIEVLTRALARLGEEAHKAGREQMLGRLSAYLTREPDAEQRRRLAESMGLSPLALSVSIKRLRQRFRQLVDNELAETVAGPADMAAEREALHRALKGN